MGLSGLVEVGPASWRGFYVRILKRKIHTRKHDAVSSVLYEYRDVEERCSTVLVVRSRPMLLVTRMNLCFILKRCSVTNRIVETVIQPFLFWLHYYLD